MSISQVLVKGKANYHLNDDVVVYFCFPTLGIIVPLRPGDYLLLNPLIPHCISSHCKHDNEIMCISMYMKTAIVGLNDNSLPLTPSQKQLADKYVNKTYRFYSLLLLFNFILKVTTPIMLRKDYNVRRIP